MKIETPIRFFLGHYPGGDEPCWGGCVNMLKGALAGFDAYKSGCLKKSRPIAVVVGEYDGDDFGCGEGRLFFAGKDADKIVAVIGPILRRHPMGRAATMQVQRGDADPETVKF